MAQLHRLQLNRTDALKVQFGIRRPESDRLRRDVALGEGR